MGNRKSQLDARDPTVVGFMARYRMDRGRSHASIEVEDSSPAAETQPGVSTPPADEESKTQGFMARYRVDCGRCRANIGAECSSSSETHFYSENPGAGKSSVDDFTMVKPSALDSPGEPIFPGESETPGRYSSVNTKPLSVSTVDAPFSTGSDIIVHASSSSLLEQVGGENGNNVSIIPTDKPAWSKRSEPLAASRKSDGNDDDNPIAGVSSETQATFLESTSEDTRESHYQWPRKHSRTDPDLESVPCSTPAVILPDKIVPSTLSQRVKYVLYKRTKTQTEVDVDLTVTRALQLIQKHQGRRGGVALPVYVRSPDGTSPRLVTLYATSEDVNDGSARKLVLKLKNVASKETDLFGKLAVVKNAPTTHRLRPSGLVAAESDCYIWVQKESSVRAYVSGTSPVDVHKDVQLNARERLGLAQLHRYQITIQCKAIERIKVEEHEFPGILPPHLRTRFVQLMKVDKKPIE